MTTTTARADSPAVTDFGLDEARAVWAGPAQAPCAMFLTLYDDGRRDLQVRDVADDAVVSFAGEHPAWRLDGSLTWFVRMPVYVRVVHQDALDAEASDM